MLNWALVTQIVTFVVVVIILYRLASQPVGAFFRTRADHVESSLRAAAENQRRAEETSRNVQSQLEQARADAQTIVAQANRAAEAQRQVLMEQARHDAVALERRAQEAIGRERQLAVDELRREAGRLAVLAAGHVVSRSLDNETNHDLADHTIAEVGGTH